MKRKIGAVVLTKTFKILFVCTGNTCRSPMAEGIFNKIAKENNLDRLAESAGIQAITGLPASENSVAVCKEIGVDLTDFTSTWICDTDPSQYEIFAVMSENHRDILVRLGIDKNKVIILNEKNNGVSDPYGGSIETYRKCRDEIRKGIEELIENFS